MKSTDNPASPYPSFDEVLDDIGDKAAEALLTAVARSKADLRTYRETHPGWVAEHSERGLANWIHDRLWTHITALTDQNPDVAIHEKGPLRELVIGNKYRFRLKRHDESGHVASYHTDAFLDFVCQPAVQLPGMEETRLIAGYEWEKDLRDIGVAVISLRDGDDNVIWSEPLSPVDAGRDAGTVVTPEQPGPTTPIVEIPSGIGVEHQQQTEGT